MIDKNGIQFSGPNDIYHTITYLWSSHHDLLTDEPEPIRDFLNRVVYNNPENEITCRHVSRYLDD